MVIRPSSGHLYLKLVQVTYSAHEIQCVLTDFKHLCGFYGIPYDIEFKVQYM